MVFGIVGPTCVGKTSISITLAQAIDGEIVSVDSRQIYKEISIGTAKPSDEELSAVPHHFISERSIAEPISAAEFAGAARERIEEIERRGKHAVLVGGSTLYLHALLFGMDDVPPADPGVRARLQGMLNSDGLEALAEELKRVDSRTYAVVDLANPRRVLRALEVFHTTGRPLSDFWARNQGGARNELGARMLVLDRDRADLYRRINARVETMVQSGLVDELKVILETGFDAKLQALQTIGYKEGVQFLAGTIDLERMIELIQRNTRRYAKRQLTWFRRYEEFAWVHVEEDESAPETCGRLLATIAT